METRLSDLFNILINSIKKKKTTQKTLGEKKNIEDLLWMGFTFRIQRGVWSYAISNLEVYLFGQASVEMFNFAFLRGKKKSKVYHARLFTKASLSNIEQSFGKKKQTQPKNPTKTNQTKKGLGEITW